MSLDYHGGFRPTLEDLKERNKAFYSSLDLFGICLLFVMRRELRFLLIVFLGAIVLVSVTEIQQHACQIDFMLFKTFKSRNSTYITTLNTTNCTSKLKYPIKNIPQSIDLVIIVLTYPKNFDQRKVQRETWIAGIYYHCL
jgi:hypothetical protein